MGRPRREGGGLSPLPHHSVPELGSQGWMGDSHPPLGWPRPGGKVDRYRVGIALSCCLLSLHLSGTWGLVSIFLSTLTLSSPLSCSKRFCRFRSF